MEAACTTLAAVSLGPVSLTEAAAPSDGCRSVCCAVETTCRETKRDTAKRVETMNKCSTHGLVGVAKRGGGVARDTPKHTLANTQSMSLNTQPYSIVRLCIAIIRNKLVGTI